MKVALTNNFMKSIEIQGTDQLKGTSDTLTVNMLNPQNKIDFTYDSYSGILGQSLITLLYPKLYP